MQIHCPVCDYTREVNLEKIPPTAEFATCPKCRHRFRFRALDLDEIEKPMPPMPNPEHADVWDAVDSLQDRWKERNGEGGETGGAEPAYEDRHASAAPSDNVAIPWENPRYLGYLKSFVSTALWVLMHPANFFSSLTKRPALLPAFGFYLAFNYIQYFFDILWRPMLFNLGREAIIERFGEETFNQIAGSGFDLAAHLPHLLVLPFSLAIQLFISTAIVHLLIKLMAPHEADFVLTMKVLTYASASAILTVIPIGGLILGPFAYVALLIIGCRNAFNLPTGKAAMAIIPLYFFVALLVGTQMAAVS